MKQEYPIVMLGSGAGSTIDFFCKKIQSQEMPATIVSIVTDNPKADLISIAKKFHIPCHILPFKSEESDKWDENLYQTLSSYQPELILLAGFLKKIGPKVLKKFKNKVINSHPALIPNFSGLGMYGSRIHQAVIDQNMKETGVTIHLVNENYDEGVILNQEIIPVKEGEGAFDLEERVKKIEKNIYVKTILQIISGEVAIDSGVIN